LRPRVATYDFNAVLDEGFATAPKQDEFAEADTAYWRRFNRDNGTPREEQLRRHAQRYGNEGVSEIAATIPNGSALAAELTESHGSRQRRTSTPLREQVLALKNRGMVRAAIADTLNVSDRRVAEILRRNAELAKSA
jgi:hypothetical protein